MRNFKLLLCYILIFNTCFLFAQNNEQNREKINFLSKTEYSKIKVNNVTLEELEGFKGEGKQLSALFNMPFQVEIPDQEVRTFKNSKILLAYGDALDHRMLYYFEILNSEIFIKIQEKTVRLGGSISELGYQKNLKATHIGNGTFSAIFKPEKEDSYICIEYDSGTGIITTINYVSLP